MNGVRSGSAAHALRRHRASRALAHDGTFISVSMWPVFIWGPMFEENAPRFAVGQDVTWVVELVDGSALGWPDDVLVDITIEIERPGPGRAGLARSPEFRVLWEGDEPAGTTLRLRGGLSAEWFMPGFRTTAEGLIRRIEIVSRRMVWEADHAIVRATGEWHLEEVSRSPRWLGPSPRPRDPPEVLHPWGLLIALDLKAITIPDRQQECTPR